MSSVWDYDGYSKFTMNLSHELRKWANDRYKNLDYENLGDYIRWLVKYDKKYDLISSASLASKEIEQQRKKRPEKKTEDNRQSPFSFLRRTTC